MALLLTSGTVRPSPTSALPLLRPWSQGPARPLYRPGELTVRFGATVSRERAAAVVAALGSEVVYAARHVPGLRVVSVPRGLTLAQALVLYRQRADVLYAEPSYLDYPTFVPNDPLFEQQWHLRKVGCPTAWDTTLGSTGVIVAILDTGVAFTDAPDHPQAPDLAGVRFVAPWDAVDGDTLPVDDEGHGTHVCGTIAQATNNALGVAGVAPGSSIMPVRTLGSGGGLHAQFAEACHYAADNGARVLNYSAGGSDSETKREGVGYAYSHGVLICAAMGNDGALDSSSAYPARYPEVIGVAASTVADQRAYYSNYGSDVDLTGPGGDTSADLDDNGFPDGVLQNTFAAGLPAGGFGYQYWMGTSMATPHVTGVAALVCAELLRRGQSPTPDGVRTILEQTAQDLGPAGRDDEFGHGLVRADLALASLDAPYLEWVGSPEFADDGVTPDQGHPDSVFQFRVRYTDPAGRSPRQANLRVQSLNCDGVWETIRTKPLERRYGRPETGAVYFASTKLPNEAYRYRFDLRTVDGPVGGAPSAWTPGPMIQGPPWLCWAGTTGFEADGVQPDTGAAGTSFTFRVRYLDSRGNGPTTRNLRLRRNGEDYRTVPLASGAGKLRTGKLFSTATRLTDPGTYEYRFDFADVHGRATGAPTRWHAGPTLDAAASLLASAAALPLSHGRAEIVFTLSGAASVSADLRNLAGRPIRSLARDRECLAGTHALLWDGRADSGLPAPAGAYLVTIHAASPTGVRARTLTLLRHNPR
jgi:serine protease